jgi:hypothetical protein
MADEDWYPHPTLTDRDVARVIAGMREGAAEVTVLSPSHGGLKSESEYTIRLAHDMVANGIVREYLVTRDQALQILEVDPDCLSSVEEPRTAIDSTKPDATEDVQHATVQHAPAREAAQVDKAPATKSCRYCGEQILAVAIKCKHCGSMLDGGPGQRKPHPEWTGAPAPASDERGILLAIIPWSGVLVCWFWIQESPLVNASQNLMILGIAVTLSTAIVAAIDSSALQLDRKHGGLGPVGTFIGVSLLWIVLYPVHMSNRGKAGVPSRLAPALVGALAFAASTVYFAVLINERLMELQRALNGL